MKKKNTILNYILFFIIVFILILIDNQSNLKHCRQYSNNLNFCGHIVKKYIDKKEHEDCILEVTSERNKVQKINLSLDHSNFFNYAQINDSVVKISGNKNVIVYRSSFDTIIVLDIKCIGF